MKKKLYDPVFIADVILITGDWNDIKMHGQMLNPDGALLSGSVSVIETKNKLGQIQREYLIHIEDPKDFYTLLHETVHLVKTIFTDRGIPFTVENDEMIAYYQSFWFKKLWRILSKKRR